MTGLSRILILDDDEEFLGLYQKLISQHVIATAGVLIANNGPRALALLESEQVGLLIIDLNLPRMDGLQVISVVRRKHPQTRLMVLTSLRDEQFRARAYALGVDQYWLKPESDHETALFLEAVGALVRSDAQPGFRGVQNKSLADIIQMECLGQNTTVLRINHGITEARIWLVRGEVIDAEAQGLQGEEAFGRILGWTGGTFECLPGDETRERTIFISVQGLLLNSAQAFDEAIGESGSEGDPSVSITDRPPVLSDLSSFPGVECAVVQSSENGKLEDHWGISDPAPLSAWVRKTMLDFRKLGESLSTGDVRRVLVAGSDRKLAMTRLGSRDVLIGFESSKDLTEARNVLRTVLTKWAS
ncbi:MAG: response regulator [Verrucomicrobia bacterium]|nr:response regulator [Verrucomicrobiota bacterium]